MLLIPLPLVDVPDDWLLDPAVARHAGLIVTVHGSVKNGSDNGWHDGAYEGTEGIVLSVFNTGPNNTMFPSTARVRFQRLRDPGVDVVVVPVSYLRPVSPNAVGQDAVIIGGRCIGEIARVREEVSGGWFVSAAYDHFEINASYLVRVSPIDE
ncbi:hypothetical protein C8Q74DRAFT_905673 [Fomes fomentarius]|nr:hypothetical protein C8Q74DRAFT_905673 [Fomes fomentarius]